MDSADVPEKIRGKKGLLAKVILTNGYAGSHGILGIKGTARTFDGLGKYGIYTGTLINGATDQNNYYFLANKKG